MSSKNQPKKLQQHRQAHVNSTNTHTLNKQQQHHTTTVNGEGPPPPSGPSSTLPPMDNHHFNVERQQPVEEAKAPSEANRSVRFNNPHFNATSSSVEGGSQYRFKGGEDLSSEVSTPLASELDGTDEDESYRAGSPSQDPTASHTSSGSGFKLRRRGKGSNFCSDIAPFFLSSMMAMAVPIILLIVYESLTLSVAVRDLTWTDEAHGLLTGVVQCHEKHMEERAHIGSLFAAATLKDQATETSAMNSARTAVDECRDTLLNTLSAHATKIPERFAPVLPTMTDDTARLQKLRSSVDSRNSTGEMEREALTEIVRNMLRIVILVDLELVDEGHDLIHTYSIASSINYLSWCRAVGVALLLDNDLTRLSALRLEYIITFASAESALHSTKALLIRSFNSFLLTNRNVQALLGSLEMLRAPNARLRLNRTAWLIDTDLGLQALFRYDENRFENLRDERALETMRTEVLKMLLGVALCCAAAALLGWHQGRLRRGMLKQLDAIAESKRAIAAFVPRQFLSAMGYTSITQVQPGSCTETAVTMLFADIRRFTTIAEGMGNTELFDWVQSYFERMTNVVEHGQGNINLFIGDALFAVFNKAIDACLTSVQMHIAVQKLNLDNRLKPLALQSRVPIEIGVGIHQDCVALGILGDERRHTCTLISASVNLASRLEGLTKQLQCRVVVSESVIGSLVEDEKERIQFRRLGCAVVKGSDSTSKIYEIFMADEDDLQSYKAATKHTFQLIVDEVAQLTANPQSSFLLLKSDFSEAANFEAEKKEIKTRSPGTSAPNSSRYRLGSLPFLSSPNGSALHHNGVNMMLPHQPQKNDEEGEEDDDRRVVDSPNNNGNNNKPPFGSFADTQSTGKVSARSDPWNSAQHTRRSTKTFYESALERFMLRARAESDYQRLVELIEALVAAQQFYEVTDHPFYCLMRYSRGNDGMVFDQK